MEHHVVPEANQFDSGERSLKERQEQKIKSQEKESAPVLDDSLTEYEQEFRSQQNEHNEKVALVQHDNLNTIETRKIVSDF